MNKCANNEDRQYGKCIQVQNQIPIQILTPDNINFTHTNKSMHYFSRETTRITNTIC